MDLELSPDQKSCMDDIMSWWKIGNSPLITFGGYAGCGKTTLIAELKKNLENVKVAFCSYTGKAASVLGSKLRAAEVLKADDYCGTIHSLIYFPILNGKNQIIGWSLKDNLPDYDLIIIDEASMVNEEVFVDLSAYNLPILAVGDHGQLPPIGGNLNLMENPQLKLEKIHRQSENNPIIALSIMAREDGFIPYGAYGTTVVKTYKKNDLIGQFLKHSGDFSQTAILCGFNKTRVKINKDIRKMFGYEDIYPQSGERVMCLKNNRQAKDCPIYNGVQGTVLHTKGMGQYLKMEVRIDGEEKTYFGPVAHDVFNVASPKMNHPKVKWMGPSDNEEYFKVEKRYPDYFDYGYALSVHKSQGSEWKRVMVIEQPCDLWKGNDWNRWLYTAITRASEQLLIVR